MADAPVSLSWIILPAASSKSESSPRDFSFAQSSSGGCNLPVDMSIPLVRARSASPFASSYDGGGWAGKDGARLRSFAGGSGRFGVDLGLVTESMLRYVRERVQPKSGGSWGRQNDRVKEGVARSKFGFLVIHIKLEGIRTSVERCVLVWYRQRRGVAFSGLRLKG